MAIKAPKRASSTAAASTAKRQASGQVQVAKQCHVVAAAVKGAAGYSESVLKIVSGNLLECLGVAKEERHPYQQQLIGMVGEVLGSVENAITKKISSAEGRLSSANAEKASRDQTHEDAKSQVAAKNDASTLAKVALADSVAATKAAKSSLTETESDQSASNAQFNAASEKKARLDFAFNDGFVSLEEGNVTGHAAKSKIATVLKVAKECEFDPSLFTSLSSTLAKSPTERGTFDALVCQQVKEQLQNNMKAVQTALATGESAKAECAGKVEAAAAALEQAQEHETSCRVTSDQSKIEAETAKTDEREAAKAVSQFGHEMKQTMKDLAIANEEHAALTGGALAAYKELLEYTAILPLAAEEAPTADVPASTQ